MRRGGWLRTTVLATALAAPGCSGIFDPDSAVVVLRTDADAYVARYEGGEGSYRQYGFTVVARVENRGGSSVYLARCYPDSRQPIYGVSLVEPGDRWGAAYNAAWACVGHDRQIRLRPGEARTDTLHLRGPNAFDGRTGEPFGSLVGRMQLHYEVQTCRGDGACRLGEDAGASNVFTVELAPPP